MRKLVWAVDNMVEDRALQAHCLPAIKMIAPEARVLPACVATPAQLFKEHAGVKDVLGHIEDKMRSELSNWLGSFQDPTLESVAILQEGRFSLRKAVQCLVDYSERMDAEMIVVSTHSRTGLKRAVLGSFAETLVCLSKRPVLVVNPKARVVPKLRHILVATDLSEKSMHALNYVIPIAKRDGAHIRIFHQVEYVNAYSSPTFHFSPLYSDYLKDDVQQRAEEGQKWAERAQQAGVSAQFSLSQTGGYPVEGIVREGKDCDLTVMASQTGPVSSAILGSVTRTVLRETDEPVLVIHPY